MTVDPILDPVLRPFMFEALRIAVRADNGMSTISALALLDRFERALSGELQELT